MKGVSLDGFQRVPFVPPVGPDRFGLLWVTLGIIGLTLLMWFFVYEVSVSAKKRSILKEIILASVTSVVLGFAFLFLLLWAGLWV